MSYPNKFNNFNTPSPYNKFQYQNYFNSNNYYNFNYNNFYNNYNYINYNINNNANINNNINRSYKLLFWNILCNEYSYDWKTSPKIELKYKVWEHRSKLFNQIFSDKNIISDIYCFVEVDKKDDLYLMLNGVINKKLFDIVYFQRPSTPLGIMILYNREKFKIINSYKYLLGKTIYQNFALVAILQEIVYPFNIFVIIVTHLKAWEKNENIRIKQVNQLFYSMANDKNLNNLKINKIIICGDLNTNPDSECIKIITDNKFNSVFDISEQSKNDGNYTMVIDTVDEGLKKLKYDYIFTNNNIEILKKILPINFLNFEKGIPNENFPSDHIYLFTEFKFCDKKNEIPYEYNKIIYNRNLNYTITIPEQNKEKNNNNNQLKKDNSSKINNIEDNKESDNKDNNHINTNEKLENNKDEKNN